MAHKVKCFYCGHTFDRDKEPAVPIEGKRRYAHKACYEKSIKLLEEEKQNREDLENYIKQLFNYEIIPDIVEKQINDYLLNKNYTYTGILNALKYFYEIKHGDKEKSYGRIGIVPYIYEDSRLYYLALLETKEKNENIKIEEYVLPQRIIHIKEPTRKPMVEVKKLFSFLDQEEDK